MAPMKQLRQTLGVICLVHAQTKSLELLSSSSSGRGSVRGCEGTSS